MYARAGTIDKILERYRDDRPFVLCEYTHAMGNSNGGLEHYWDQLWENPRIAGYFVWDWMDQGLGKPSPTEKAMPGVAVHFLPTVVGGKISTVFTTTEIFA